MQGWVTSRRDGTSRYYSSGALSGRMVRRRNSGSSRVSSSNGRPVIDQDARRLARVLAKRSATSQQFFASSAGQWDHLREELFGA